MDIGSLNSSDRTRSYYEAVRPDMLKYIPPEARVTLEFGCGFGGFSALLKEVRGIETWAVEIDRTAAEEAARKLDKVICADAQEALDQIPDHRFDCIIFFDILEHLVDPCGLLLAVKPKLRERGVVVASIPNIRYYDAFVDYVVRGDWQYQAKGVLDASHLRFFTRKSIIRLFDHLGFRILLLEGIHATRSRTYRRLNRILFNAISDVRYMHFAVVASDKNEVVK